MSGTDLNNPTPPTNPTPTSPAPTTPPASNPPAAPAAPAAPASLVGNAPPPATWAEYVPDPAKSAEENATAKAAHDATKPAPVAPAAADPALTAPLDFKSIKIPEGFQVDEALSNEFTEIVNDDKLSRADRAQKLIDLQAKLMSGLSERGKTEWNNLQADWTQKTQADPDVGGAKLPAVLQDIGTILDTYGTPELREVFTLTGAGNHPEMVKFLYKIAGKLKEGGPVSGAPTSQPGGDAKSLYPNTQLT